MPLVDLDRRHDRQYIRLFLVHRNLDVVLIAHPLCALSKLLPGYSKRATGLGCGFGNLVQLMRNQASLEHAMPGH
jgi:hypothetical protein